MSTKTTRAHFSGGPWAGETRILQGEPAHLTLFIPPRLRAVVEGDPPPPEEDLDVEVAAYLHVGGGLYNYSPGQEDHHAV